MAVVYSYKYNLSSVEVSHFAWVPIYAMGLFHTNAEFLRIQRQRREGIEIFLMTPIPSRVGDTNDFRRR